MLTGSKTRYNEEAIIDGGIKPIVAPYDIEKLKELEDKDVTIIVPNEDLKTEIQEIYENTVLTIYESKGLERENIICINVARNFREDIEDVVVALDSDKKMSNHYRYFFNLFYVATTRARKKLIYLDDMKNPIYDLLEDRVEKRIDWNLDGIEELTNDRLLTYAIEFENRSLYKEALKNYDKLGENYSEDILRLKSLIAYDEKEYEKALKGFESLNLWEEIIKCCKNLGYVEKEYKYQTKIYIKDKDYYSLSKLQYDHNDIQLALNSFITLIYLTNVSYKERELLNKIVSKISYEDISGEQREEIANFIVEYPEFLKLVGIEGLLSLEGTEELKRSLKEFGRFLTKNEYESLSDYNKKFYKEFYIKSIEEDIDTRLSIINYSKEEKELSINGKLVRTLRAMKKVSIEIEEDIEISLGKEIQEISLESVILGKNILLFK